MDLRPPCLEASRSTSRPPAACSHRELPCPGPAPSATQPSASPEATYSNVGLAAIPRASLAASPMVWAGARLTSGCARPRPEASPVVAEYACVQKLKRADPGPQGPEQGKAKGAPATQVKQRVWPGVGLGISLAGWLVLTLPWVGLCLQVDILYSRVSKPKRKEPEPAIDPLDSKGRGTGLTLGSNQACETLPLRSLSVDKGLLENVYESIQEMGAPECQEPPSSSC